LHLSAGENKNDRLTAYDGTSITYDEIGNPITIGSMELTWEGRQLVEYGNAAMMYSYKYTYNADGIRTSKNIDGTVHSYVLDGSRIVSETIGSAYIFIYLYDEAGSPIGIKFRRGNYAAGEYDYFFFEKNLQGDIVAIYNESGTKVATYTYDAWGKVITTLESGAVGLDGYVANNNPFRYRGYYYDTETGWYYLQSRYYNPTWGRFLNADGYLATGGFVGYNLFAYCYNNPVNYVDYCGESGTAVATWTASAWFLTLLDGPLPIGDIIYGAGIVVMGIATVALASELADDGINTHPIENEDIGIESLPEQNQSVEIESVPATPPLDPVKIISVEHRISSIETFPTNNIGQYTVVFKGKENKKLTKYRNLSDKEIIEIYKNPKTSKKEKLDLQMEQKARGLRNVNKRKELYK